MKLLFDENLSHRLCTLLSREFPFPAHVRDFNLQSADDLTVWEFARLNDYTIVSKDSDFHQRSFVYGHPPKVVWLQAGNASTAQIAEMLKSHVSDLVAFAADENASFLTIA